MDIIMYVGDMSLCIGRRVNAYYERIASLLESETSREPGIPESQRRPFATLQVGLITCPVMCGMKLLIHSQISAAASLKFWND